MTLVKLKKLTYSYSTKPVFSDLNLEINAGEIVCIIGPNGSGKSTLLKCICSILHPNSGIIEKSKSTRIAYIPQKLGLVQSKSVLTNILLGSLPNYNFLRSLLCLYKKEDIEKAKKIAKQFNLTPVLNQKCFQLSGGQQKLVAIARSLMIKPKLIVADEILSNLDLNRNRQIIKYLKSIAKKGVSVLIVEHDFCIGKNLTDQMYLLSNGKLSKQEQLCNLSKSKLCKLYQ